ncbi:unnamed protein product [Parnassius apollo]|uniref:(apollo) hypothetical protein n=1 Tax=Parnassius apollo TaxID=110799 RepID=A0A8S3Y8H4_PARAO|nr:unnamed protein product [Parnassius apollo]
MYISFVALFALALASSSSSNKQYRTDYVYNSKTDAFYKLHIETVWNNRAKSICQTEGASLMITASQQDIMQLHAMIKEFPDIGDYAWVGNDGLAHDSAEEQPIINLDAPTDITLSKKNECEVLTRSGDVETHTCFSLLPFICKVKAESARYDPECDVYGDGYQYYESVGSCYKISRVAFSWSQAYEECRAEGSHLVVLNSMTEDQLIYNILKTPPHVIGAKATWFFFAGFRAHKTTDGTPRVFKTIFNQTLEEAGFNQWSLNEPNNAFGNEYCGTIFKNDGKYNDVDCSHQYGFICEKEIKKVRAK